MNFTEIQNHFPQLKKMNGSGLVYLDSAATSLKLGSVTKAQYDFDSFSTSNVHRGAHRLSTEATNKYENTRKKTASYLNCSSENIAFTYGTTDSINTVAYSLEKKIKASHSIFVAAQEHHANLLPWQRLAQKTGAKLLIAPLDEMQDLDINAFEKILKENNVYITAVAHASNTSGSVLPLDTVSSLCQQYESKLLIDAAQSISFYKYDLKKIDCDYLCFSAHKVFGPFGLGILYFKAAEDLIPLRLGGGIVDQVEFQKTTYLKPPQSLEAGTPNISAVIAFAEVVDFLQNLDLNQVQDHEAHLLSEAEKKLSLISGYQPVGKSKTRTNVLSFNFTGVHPHDLCTLLDEQGFALRAGHHCTQPLLRILGLEGCARASFSIYNNKNEIDLFISAINRSLEILR